MRSKGTPYDSRVIGIVSTNPGLVAGNGGIDVSHTDDVMVALVGRVPVRVSTEGGEIKPGDRLTSSSLPGVAMKATTSGMTIGVALETFNGSEELSEGVVRVETHTEFTEKTLQVTKKVMEDNRFYGGELSEGQSPGAWEELLREETVRADTSTEVVPENGPAPIESTPSGASVKVGKVLMFVNLGYTRLDDAISGLASTTSLGTDGISWTTVVETGKAVANFLGNIDMQGNNILGIGKMAGKFGNWSIDENGKLIAEEVEAKRGTFKDSLDVGTPEKPAGITIYDSSTGEPYCLEVKDGQMRSTAGACTQIPPEEPEPAPSSAPPTPESPPESPPAEPAPDPLPESPPPSDSPPSETPVTEPAPVPPETETPTQTESVSSEEPPPQITEDPPAESSPAPEPVSEPAPESPSETASPPE